MKNIYMIIVLFFALAGFGGGALAQAPAFFSVLSDVPAMDGLYEVSEHTLFFDKAEGRIADLTLAMENVTADQVRHYYKQALPQFGWSDGGESKFIREGEVLSFEFLRDDFVKISVHPR